MEVVTINRDDVLVGEDSLQDYIDLLNGITYECAMGNYKQGSRNDIAVCLTVSAHSLGIDPEELLDKMIKLGLIDPDKDDEDPHVRVRTIMDYKRRFDWDWMPYPEYYANRIIAAGDDEDYIPKIVFKL